MTLMRRPLVLLAASLLVACKSPGPTARDGSAAPPPAPNPASTDRGAAKDHDLPIEKLKLPPGFQVDVYAANVKNARSMVLSPNGTLFVGTRKEGSVYAIPNTDRNAWGDRVIEIASGLEMPNGVALHAGALYVAEVSRVLRFDEIEKRLDDPPKPVELPTRFPTDEHHGWKFIAIGPDEKLYVPVGAPCNICQRGEKVYASITRMNLDGSGFEVYAHGIRNTVGFAWHPETKELWFTDNGRDMLGDDIPPDELNRAPKAGLHFGYPFCHGKAIVDPELGNPKSCEQSTPPVAELGPHVAALGMRFYTGKMFPEEYRNLILIAEHGSWNRSTKIGYRVMRVRPNGDRADDYRPFVTGWLEDDEPWGRPVDVLVMPDGALLVSDDYADAIYRISYRAKPG
jgi:glucose/arabinose dehydrogenase